MLMVGGTDVGAKMMAIDCTRKGDNVRATSVAEALPDGNAVHGGPGSDNLCGDLLRKTVIDTLQREKGTDLPERGGGWDKFDVYPAWNAITHQAMFVDWIRRAVQYGGLRVMVALAVNNKTLADAVRGPGDTAPADDKGSAELQIDEMIRFVERHPDLMEIARTPQDLYRIVWSNRLAVVLGVEIDAIGNLYRPVRGTPSPEVIRQVQAEIDRLYERGVRYAFLVHVLDNAFAGTALYETVFAMSNFREFGAYPQWACATREQLVRRKYEPKIGVANFFAGLVKLGTRFPQAPAAPACEFGHVNQRGMTPLGRIAMVHMMRKGMLIDVDHMSDKTLACALELAESVPGKYPLISGHTGLRTGAPGDGENLRTREQLARIRDTGGMFGLGTEAALPRAWRRAYREVQQIMGSGKVAIGSDVNGLVSLPRPPGDIYDLYPLYLPAPTMGKRSWHYSRDGVAHYGMFADFLKAVQLYDGEDVIESLMQSAGQFARTWEKAVAQRGRVDDGLLSACQRVLTID